LGGIGGQAVGASRYRQKVCRDVILISGPIYCVIFL
jgi:hypothetical protein